MDDFLSKKDLQEILKSKWADLLIHGDVTILTYEFVLNKYLLTIDKFFDHIVRFRHLFAGESPKISNCQDYPNADCKSQVGDPKAFGAAIYLSWFHWKMSHS